MDAAEAEARAEELRQEAARHKRAVNQHRRRLRKARQELADLAALCEAEGIQLTIHGEGEGDRHGR